MNLICGDSKEKIKELEKNSVDYILTDPPYAINFMNNNFDKMLPDKEIWKNCLEVLKDGAFMCVFSSSRQDCLWKILRDIEESGFSLKNTFLNWVYHTGMPKATNYYKLTKKEEMKGKYSFSPKPSFEVIIVAQKPITKNTIKEQIEENGKACVYFDECRVPTKDNITRTHKVALKKKRYPCNENNLIYGIFKTKEKTGGHENGRFPTNLIIEDESLSCYKFNDLDKWFEHKFIDIPKATKKEKDKGCEHLEEKISFTKNYGFSLPQSIINRGRNPKNHNFHVKNFHPTVKPVKLCCYLLSMFTKKGEIVLDPFMGSGTTGIACKLLDRDFIGIELNEEYYNLAKERIKHF